MSVLTGLSVLSGSFKKTSFVSTKYLRHKKDISVKRGSIVYRLARAKSEVLVTIFIICSHKNIIVG